jgi:membrane-bound ClpP family serine protease
MDILIVVILCILGILLILVEIFLIPGVTLMAVLGGAFSIGGIWYAFNHLGTMGGMATLVLTVLFIGVAFVYLIKSKALDSIALKTDIDSTVTSDNPAQVKEGEEGITISRLNPIGKVKVNDITMEGKSLGDFIDEDTEIVVLKVTPTQLIVKTK